MLTYEEIMGAIQEVEDPELGISIVDLGLVYDAEEKKGHVSVTMTLTSPGCPVGPQLRNQVQEAVIKLPGVKTVAVEVVWFPPWDPTTMATEDGKAALGIW